MDSKMDRQTRLHWHMPCLLWSKLCAVKWSHEKISALAPCGHACVERRRFQHGQWRTRRRSIRRTRVLHCAEFATDFPDVADTDSLRLRTSYAGGKGSGRVTSATCHGHQPLHRSMCARSQLLVQNILQFRPTTSRL